ncbi:MSMEG_1061 family FMN-dependent PPOX-type flavoprotein [Rhodospirillum rubrum]|uniref:Pyridoxamine 5'-phosphate oxidase-related, FMN-binding n=1 Tax=Rhodospirillum rubrum (strain ATCC 11170 / ATH 1.1.1 / DSM 467 / LMG 4362 / NCIMB 8255 / S1) TaxID=269796 RepID=Q2RPM3_RHORT|nr:MSMEG_1061 family FMN-dependent PPOX-type flavoprotein [Rhodospirillum rubrum]ABC23922.1 Pyridoxamine 5'-phosphate oxidase-related, FMN-binding [Rhodospirillum rubrum ATCC 11170]AEO49666.1 pyridoxamine 5'-phosphate oxidase-related, FMN-binding protein [Rhodospirillum rubrum F11]MBK5955620.1 pyridoxamine 5'-phosphate oxidase [Rhodospirillum rubrum]QXG79866.1 pyridoxamine 5'-phosphate oxidase family protein [Rhodospirillum rubrum]HAP99083.1 pyridoxamine 5'-phosphate oxidase [Rhodospirillum ru
MAIPDETGQGPSDTPNLDELYAQPSEMIQKAVLDHLVEAHAAYLKVATFFCLATAGGAGLDASPRGGPPGFVKMIDAHRVVFADWPGNNRIESMRNLDQDDRVGMLFLFPGLDVFLRINGRARLTTEPALLASLAEGNRPPKVATVVHVTEVLFHCGKAAHRAHLWDGPSKIGPGVVPTVGAVMASFRLLGEAQVAQVDAAYAQAVRTELY